MASLTEGEAGVSTESLCVSEDTDPSYKNEIKKRKKKKKEEKKGCASATCRRVWSTRPGGPAVFIIIQNRSDRKQLREVGFRQVGEAILRTASQEGALGRAMM